MKQVFSAPVPTTGQTVREHRLPIPDRPSDKDAPPEGWCGEASIQMAALYFGAYIPQYMINKAGKPAHPDLWEHDIPTALDALSLSYEQWQRAAPKPSRIQSPDGIRSVAEATFEKDIPVLLGWIRWQIGQDHPVVIGTKIYPTSTVTVLPNMLSSCCFR
jgi:hypothetical protein